MGKIDIYNSLNASFLPDFSSIGGDFLDYARLLKWLHVNGFHKAGKNDYVMFHHFRFVIHCLLLDNGVVEFYSKIEKTKETIVFDIKALEEMASASKYFEANVSLSYDFLKGILRNLAAETLKKTMFTTNSRI